MRSSFSHAFQSFFLESLLSKSYYFGMVVVIIILGGTDNGWGGYGFSLFFFSC